MKVCIIYPPYWYVENQPSIKAVSDNYGVYPNLSLAHVAAILENEGHSVRFIDANALNLTKEQVLKRIKQFDPDLLAFTITTYLIHQNISWVKYLKEQTGLPVLVGGMHFNFYPYETFTHNCFDYAILGEAECTLPKFMNALEKGGDLSKVDSIMFRKKGKIIKNGVGKIVKDLDSVPFPARHLLPNEKYYEFISQRKNFTGLITSRGCPFRCIYCEQGSKQFRARSAVNIADEFEECYTDYNIREIDVFDSSFTINKKRVLDTCFEITSRKLDVEWAVRSRVDCVDREMLQALKKAGCVRIYYGVESGNSQILQTLRKMTDLNKIKETINITKQEGLRTFGYFMVGNPSETVNTIKQTIKFAQSLDLDYAQFSKVSPLPGTELYEMLMKEAGEDYWKEFVKDESVKKILGRPGCSLSDDEIQMWVKKAYNRFYFRPSYIYKATKRLRSYEELRRSANAAFDLMKFKKEDTAEGN